MALLNEVQRPRRYNNNDYEDKSKKLTSRLITAIAAVILICCLIVLFDYFYKGWRNQQIIKDAQDAHGQGGDVVEIEPDEELPLLPSAVGLLKQNPDTVGWINVPNTKIDLPVVKASNEEGMKNDYYLTHNFLREENKAGTVFADYRTTIKSKKQSDNIILYGHNELNNTMFGDLDKYKDGFYGSVDFYKKSPTFTFSTNYEEAEYKVFAYFVISANPAHEKRTEFFDYQNYVDFTEERYNDFINNVMARTKIITDVDVQYGDRFVTLSTCSKEFKDARFIVIGRKVREGESSFVDVEKAYTNNDALDPDWNLIFKG